MKSGWWWTIFLFIPLIGCRPAPEAATPPTTATAVPPTPLEGTLLFASRRLDSNGDGMVQPPDAIHLYTLNLASGQVRQLTRADAYNTYPAWSPNGQQIAFVSTRTGGVDLFLMNADGTAVQQLTSHSGQVSRPRWLSETRIAFLVDGELWYAWDVATAVATPIDPPPPAPQDGRLLIQVIEQADSSYLEVTRLDEAGQAVATAVYLANDPFYESHPALQPSPAP